MDHLHTRCSGPTALHTLLPGITFVAQNIPGEEEMEVRLDKAHRGNSGDGFSTHVLPQQGVLNDVQLAFECLQLVVELQALHH